MGYGTHLFYPAAVHQYLSPNDNKLHGAAKSKWRSMFTAFDNDIEGSIALLNCLDSVSSDSIRSWWMRNLFLANGMVRDEQIRKNIFDAQSKWTGIHEACINEYDTWSAHETRVSTGKGGSPSRANSGLDGPYWTKKQKRQ